MLRQRILTAAFLIPVALAIVFLLPLEWFNWVIGGVMVLAAWEWAPLMGVCKTAGRSLYCLLVGICVAVLAYITPVGSIWSATELANAVFYPVLVGGIWWLFAIFLVFTFPRSRAVWAKSRAFVGAFGILVLIPAWAALLSLRSLHYDDNPYFGSWTVLFLFLLVWAADIGAFFAGKKFGKHKLMPHVSPGKTKEGFVGGLVFSIGVMSIVAFTLPVPSNILLAFYLVATLSVIVSVFGDLNESMFKRCAGVKDSGSLLPGHGGILDRIDSLTSALPIFLLGYLWLIHPYFGSS
ncbi:MULTISPECIES: phosphatidate cytidylyltransferase [Gammaproteobacteria]|uniref:phosphatidate cytidylyltransferase n=1 Tax=Gammaproteobacteria TaxID=1236 RepID=UPI000DCFB4E1|nr:MULTISPECIES: phosphatidate cytidylyltransferase [Gammaproteobacteria]RTE86998.1 CDP-diglyceride synthetase [Aliidiomarina sp. B3213]TCZ93212.1 CDP-diglyceride synthetase [Lysobacter sp. N42]